jgi:hypothetical protein
MIFDFKNVNYDFHKKQIENNGYTVLRNVISISFLREIEKECLKLSWSLIGKAEINVIIDKKKCILSSSHNLANISKKFSYLINHADIKNFFLKTIGEIPNTSEMINSSYFFKTKESKEIKLHQDNAYFNLISGLDCLTFYIPIHSQSRKNGTIFYFQGSHKIDLLDHVPEGNLGTSMCLKNDIALKKLKNFKIEYLELKPGDIVIHNAQVVHGTLGNPKGQKCEAFNFTLFSKSNLINKKKYSKYKKQLQTFLSKKMDKQ